MSEDTLWTTADVADLLGISERGVRELVATGVLAAINVSRGEERPRWRFTRAQINDFLAARKSA